MLTLERIFEILDSGDLIVRDGREYQDETGVIAYFVEIPEKVAGEKYLVYVRREHRGLVRILRRMSNRGIVRGIMSAFYPYFSFISTRHGGGQADELVHSFGSADSERLFNKLESLFRC